MARRRAKQLALPLPPPWGGRRAGVGRKPSAARPGVWHLRRPEHDEDHPVLVTLRADRRLPSLRSEKLFVELRAALTRSQRCDFRVVHFSVQTDHVHLIIEADARNSLVRGIQGLAGRCARAINRAATRRGKVWSDRYHARALRTPREVRTALIYVLQNFRKHLRAPAVIDPRSSGAWFDGWARGAEPSAQPSPVKSARTWLAASGWRRAGGCIGFHEAPLPSTGKQCQIKLRATARVTR
jgi:putative transposase